MTQVPCGRYAPSPSGRLHAGNLRTALLAWLQARLAGGRFLLRIDDLDQPRCVPGATRQMLADLRWLGLDWDRAPPLDTTELRQSQRVALYQHAFEVLQAEQRVFACGCSRKDIATAAGAPHGRGGDTIYPGTCRPRAQVSPAAATDSQVDPQAWRFQVADQWVVFDDCLRGRVQQNLAQAVGDFVVKRRDGVFAYQLASVVDDARLGVTDVLRGADLVDSTPRQLALFDALGYARPRFWHVPLMTDAQAQRLSKRDGADSLDSFRRRGLDAADVVGYLAASCGLLEHAARLSAAALLKSLSLDEFRHRLRQRGDIKGLRPRG